VAGQTAQAPPNRAYVLGFSIGFLRKFSDDGTELWSRQFGTPGAVLATGVTVDSAGNSYVVGQTEEALPGQTSFGRSDAFIRSYDPNGNQRWTRQFGTPSPQRANAVADAGDGSLFMVGNTTGALLGQTALGTVDGFLMKQDVGPPGDPLGPLPTARPAGAMSAVSTVPPTPLDPARPTPSTPVTAPTVTPIDRAPNTSACSAPSLAGGPIPIGWILLTMIPASLAVAGWRRRRLRGGRQYTR